MPLIEKKAMSDLVMGYHSFHNWFQLSQRDFDFGDTIVKLVLVIFFVHAFAPLRLIQPLCQS